MLLMHLNLIWTLYHITRKYRVKYRNASNLWGIFQLDKENYYT